MPSIGSVRIVSSTAIALCWWCVPMLRADGRHNRAQLLDAARVTFATEGVDASLREVARRAGLSEIWLLCTSGGDSVFLTARCCGV
jgi:hypothetical protein